MDTLSAPSSLFVVCQISEGCGRFDRNTYRACSPTCDEPVSVCIQGNKVKARAAYQDFLTIWKDADKDIAALKQAGSEFAKLM